MAIASNSPIKWFPKNYECLLAFYSWGHRTQWAWYPEWLRWKLRIWVCEDWQSTGKSPDTFADSLFLQRVPLASGTTRGVKFAAHKEVPGIPQNDHCFLDLFPVHIWCVHACMHAICAYVPNWIWQLRCIPHRFGWELLKEAHQNGIAYGRMTKDSCRRSMRLGGIWAVMPWNPCLGMRLSRSTTTKMANQDEWASLTSWKPVSV